MKNILTIIIDGFGLRNSSSGNAIKLANMPTFINLWNKYPHCQLLASEEAVGLLKEEAGSGEVGHLTIGAGRKIKQRNSRIKDFFESSLEDSSSLEDLVSYATTFQKNVHIISDCNKKTSSNLKKLITKLNKENVQNICLHAITTNKNSYSYLNELKTILEDLKIGTIATVCGSFYAKSNKWEQSKIYVDALTISKGAKINNLATAINYCYQRGLFDTYIPPLILDESKRINDGDIVLFLDYEPNSLDKITKALLDPAFDIYPVTKLPTIRPYTLFENEQSKNTKYFLANKKVTNTLGVYFSQLGLSQARIAEEIKARDVSYYFDGNQKLTLPLCDNYIIPSIKHKNLEDNPEMRAIELTKTCLECIEKDYDFILLNYANPDVIGHTKNIPATIKALETVDICLKKVVDTALENFYTVIILSDHGNCENIDNNPEKKYNTHTLSPVPFIITDKNVQLKNGDLTNVAPTILKYMDIAIPKEMQATDTLFK